jgi:hypothetical protein
MVLYLILPASPILGFFAWWSTRDGLLDDESSKESVK